MIEENLAIDPDDAESAKRRLRTIPQRSGIYLMKDEDGKVIYVGKAINLRSRLRSYFNGSDGRASVPILVSRVRKIETIVTEDEQQALILESDLIKKHKPRYNVRLKDDRAHLVVRIDGNHEWPKIELVRQVKEDGARYIGPFAYGHELKRLLEIVRHAVPLRSCSDRVIYNRVRPCLEYQIKRCAAPCCLDVDRDQYRDWIRTAISILEGKNRDILRDLADEMERASTELRFEDAAAVRDRMQTLKQLIVEKPVLSFQPGSKDAFGIHRQGSDVELSVLMVRRGRLFGAKSFGFRDVEIPDEELLSSVMTQFYAAENDLPDQIIIPFPLEDSRAREQLYTERNGDPVKIRCPERGTLERLARLAKDNATENFTGRFGAALGEDSAVKQLQGELGLAELPRTMECVDVSHFQGGSTVGSVVFFQDGQPDKTRYRHFHLSQEGKPDDFASMREIVTRHLSRGAEENTLVDLMVIDGGRAQLAQARAVRAELGLAGPMMIGLAKKRTAELPYFALPKPRRLGERGGKPERVYIEDRTTPVVLHESSKALHLLERIRNEAHRFAITFHRSTRSKRNFRSLLERIPGVGEKRRLQLLREFGGIGGVAAASPDELVAKCGIPRKLAELILKTLHRRQANQSQGQNDAE